MKVWIDGQCLQTASRLRGIGRYVQELLRALAGEDLNLSISFNAAMSDEAIAARDFVAQWIDPRQIHVWNGVAEGGEGVVGYSERRRLSEVALAHHVACLNPDIAISASPFEGVGDLAVPLTPRSVPGVPIASIFYDAIPHRFADRYLSNPKFKSHYYRRLSFYESFDLNLCISDFSRDEAIDISKNTNSISIFAGISPDFLELLHHELAAVAGMPEKGFALYVGALDWRKNVKIIPDAFANLPFNLRNSLKLVLAGDQHPGLLEDIRAHWVGLGLPESNFVSLGHVSDSDLVALYKAAAVVIQPSLMEGFGLTALEAMVCGTPVIGSNAGALPEVVGNPDLLFDPRSPDELAVRIERIFTDREFTAHAVTTSRERALDLTWSRSARIASAALTETVGTQRSRKVCPPIAKIRSNTLAALGAIDLPADLLADIFARAEPQEPLGNRLLIDATSTVRVDHGTGIQRVTKQIVRNLVGREDQDNIVVYSDSPEGFYRVGFDGRAPAQAVDRLPEKKARFLWGDTVLMLDSSWEFHHSHLPMLLTARMRGAEVVSCLYDTVPLRYEAMCHPGIPLIFADWFRSALTYSTGFVCISQAVADELYALLQGIGFPRPMKIGYWHLGADFSTEPAAFEPDLSSGRPTCLMVGTVEPRKGHSLALDAFEDLWRANVDVELVIVGRPGWGVEHLVQRLRSHAEAGRRLRWYDKASDRDLQRLYAQSDVLIAASYAEGFGLPLVEARHFGKPVIASDIPVFREVTDGAQSARFFDVGSAAALAAAVETFLDDKQMGRLSAIEDRPWIDWRKSADEIRQVVVGGNWYKLYEPPVRKPYVSIFDHGRTTVAGPLGENDRAHRMELVEGPISSEGGTRRRYILRLTNLSKSVWSSANDSSGALGVAMSYHVLGADGGVIAYDNPRSRFPFVLTPGDSHYIAVEVPSEWREKGAAFIDVELVQEGVAWWGNALRLPL